MNSISHSIRFITLISTILTIIPISDTYSSPDSQTYDIKTDFTIVMIIPLIFNFLNLFGSLYICYRTYLLWKYDYDKFIPLSTRFPFYIAITDFLFSMIIVIDFSYSASNVTVLEDEGIDGVVTWPSPYCEMLGLLNTSFILLNMTLVGAISVTTWLRVVRECYFNWGKYDYKIWFPIIFVSFIIPLISAREFGAQKYW
ncbi:hypothetical protein C1645_572104 [Glomus cerebriforme]|uniref:G-protein coupled receptors family 1 profile domain-containing protein n=1 Tax=Glomus cerebriforme TaxID=658196 RepID=A0A397T7S8_9GLOM|nr:hypothetical protein C1645_572104 [Glomus cerebriforme]